MTGKLATIVLVFIFLTCSCGGCSGSASGNAQLRVLNASALNYDPINVAVGGEVVVSGLLHSMCVYEICQTLSGYMQVKSGGVSFALEDPDLSPTNNLVPSQFQNLNLASNTQNTFVLTGPARLDLNGPYVGYVFVDDNVPAANSVKIRIVNVDPRNGLVSVFILPDGAMPSGNPTISNLTLGTASNYITLSPGSYTVWFVGSFGILGPAQYMSWGPTTYPANRNFSVYLMQELSDSNRAVILADN